jgi:hypothetical protein
MPEPGFVRANGIHFSLDGQPFRVAGANNYYLGFDFGFDGNACL